MGAVNTLSVVLILAALALCGLGGWALLEVARASRSTRALSDETRAHLIPLLEKADVTIDALNAELLRVDMIVTRVEDASDRIASASETISDMAAMPERIAGGIAERVRAWRERRDAEPPTDDESVDAAQVEATEDGAPDREIEIPEEPWQATASH